uniref:Protein quiver n=1 Tax=Bombyx mori TaxID=7091 RepID=A0A8R2M763_BOMMO|nr:uncharacterized protein LOC110386155 isoform X2 [Bombyx mori]
MKTILSLLLFLYSLFQSGSMDDGSYSVTNQDFQANKSFWPFPMTGARKRSRPCPKRLHFGDNDNEWIPSFRAQVKSSNNHQNTLNVSPANEYQQIQRQPSKYFEAQTNLRDSATTENIFYQYLQQQQNNVIPSAERNISAATTNNESVGKNLRDIHFEKIQDDEVENIDNAISYLSKSNNPQTVDEISSNENVECEPTSSEEADSRRTKLDKSMVYVTVTEKLIKCIPIKSFTETEQLKHLSSSDVNVVYRKNADRLNRKQNFETKKILVDDTKNAKFDKQTGVSFKNHEMPRAGDTQVASLHNTRICYACSSVSDPTCWMPDKMTTVKYCRKGHNTCISKTIKSNNELIMVRDCGVSCEANSFPDLIPRYESCSVCHTDFCNSASIVGHNFLLLYLVITVLKYALAYFS